MKIIISMESVWKQIPLEASYLAMRRRIIFVVNGYSEVATEDQHFFPVSCDLGFVRY